MKLLQGEQTSDGSSPIAKKARDALDNPFMLSTVNTLLTRSKVDDMETTEPEIFIFENPNRV
jgi:hypothetical protein